MPNLCTDWNSDNTSQAFGSNGMPLGSLLATRAAVLSMI
jgi:hypothetical protein